MLNCNNGNCKVRKTRYVNQNFDSILKVIWRTKDQFLEQHKIYHHVAHKNLMEVDAGNFL